MLIVIAIIAILAAAMAYAVGGAQESTKVAKTRAIIAKLHTLVAQKYESYRNRRLPIAIPPTVIDPTTKTVIPTPARAVAKVRCDALRALMKMEMPERWTDITDDPAMSPIKIVKPGAPGTNPATWPAYGDVNAPSKAAVVTLQRPSVTQAYLAAYNAVNVPSNTAFQKDPTNNQDASCLYLLVTMGLDEQDILENFSQSDIGDPGHTGCKMFLDAWGNPIRFLRWAPGFISPLQPDAPSTASPSDVRMADQTDPSGIYGSPKPGSIAAGGAGRVRGNTFALFPLIYSAGPDGHFDVQPGVYSAGVPFHYSQAMPPNNPFESVWNKGQFQAGPIGVPVVDSTDRTTRSAFGNADNITNHEIGAR
jgi:hypothetical protein